MNRSHLSTPLGLIILSFFCSNLFAQTVTNINTTRLSTPVPVLNGSVPIGPVFPPPLGVTWNGSGNSGGAGGATWNYQDILLANYDMVYWGTANDAILLSFNDSIYTTNEIMRFNSTLSNLTSGVLVWSGNTFFPARPDTVFTRFTLRLRNYANGDELSALPVDSVLLPANVGGVLWIYGGLAFTVNFIYEASFVKESQYQPAFEFFDANKQGAELPYLSFSAGFYYVNSDPALTANTILPVNEGQQILLTVDYLSASDVESDKAEIFFNIAPQDMGDAPHSGWLKRNDIQIQKGDSFTLDDLEQNRIYYEHDGSESTWDNFTFNVSDGDGGVTPGGEFLTFTFNFSIVPQNDPPLPLDKLAHLRMNTVLYKSFTAVDVDTPAQDLSFSIIKNGKKGLASLINTTGYFSYTPAEDETGVDSIYFQVYDGSSFAIEPGHFIIVIDPVPVLPAGYLLFGDSRNSQIRIINPATGEDTVYVKLFGPDVNQRTEVRDLVLDEYGNLFTLTSDTGLLRTDYLSGETTQLIPADSFSFPLSIDRASNGDLFICDGVRGILKLDYQSGNFTVLAVGDLLTFPAGIDLSTDGFLYVTDVEDLGVSNGRIVRIDPESGAQVLISSETYLSDPVGITTTNEGIIYVADMNAFGGSGHVVKINAQNGSQEILSSGQNLIDPFGIDLYDGKLYVSDFNTKSIVEIDTADGIQNVVFADTTLQNLMGIFVIPSSIIIDVVHEEVNEGPLDYALSQNFPNPFNPNTTIQYSLPKSGMVKIDIYTITGRYVNTLVYEEQKAGKHSVTFNTKNQASGIYVYRMSVNGRSITQRRMVLLK